MKVDNVLADKMIQLGFGVLAPVIVEIQPFTVAQVLAAGHIADRRIQPDIKIFARCIGDLEAEVRRITADVPFLQAGLQPFSQFVGHLVLQMTGACPLFQEIGEILQFEKIMLGGLDHRPGAGDGGIRVDQFGRGIGAAADFAIVAVLVFGLAFGAATLDKTVGQKQAFFRVVELFDLAFGDMAVVAQAGVDQLTVMAVLCRVGGVEVVKIDQKAGKVLFVGCLDNVDLLLCRYAQLLGFQHDGRAVSIVGTNIAAVVAAHFLEAHPDIGLDGFQDMTQVQGAIGVGQGAGYQNLSFGGGHGWHKSLLVCS